MDANKEFLREGMEQLSEKQSEEMEKMLTKRYGTPQPVHTDDKTRSQTVAELFSGLPVEE